MSESDEIKVTTTKRYCETLEGELQKPAFVEKAKENTFFKHLMKEYLLSDVAPLLGEVQRRVLEGAYSANIARQLAWVIETNQPKVRAYKLAKGAAGRVVEGAPPALLGPKPEYVDIDVNIELGVRVAVSRSFLEDSPPGILERMSYDAGMAVAEAELTEFEAHIDAITESTLAGGAAQSPGTGTKFVFTDYLKLLKVVDAGNYYKVGSRMVCVMNPESLYDALLADALWIDSRYRTSVELNLPGAVAQDIFGVTFFRSNIIDSGDVWLLNADYGIGMALRRDLTIDPFEDSRQTGFDVTERFGFKTLVSKAIAKMTGA